MKGEGVPSHWFAAEALSVFESLRSYGGVIFKVGEHLDRLFASAKTAGVVIRESRAELTRKLYRVLRESGLGEAFLRLTVTRGEAMVTVGTRDYPAEVYARGVRVRTTCVRKSTPRAFFSEAKTSNYGGQMMATMEMPGEIFEVLFLGEQGYAGETRTSNVFMVKLGVLSTPPAAGILDGVTRRTVLALARALGIEARESELTRHDLFNADEVFLTNTSGELIPVREMDGRAIARAPGPWTQRLQAAFRAKVRESIRASLKERRHDQG